MNLNTLFMLSIVLVISVIAQTVTQKLKLPTVTGYVLIGVFFGKSLLGFFDETFLINVDIINDLALGAMAFTIGSELKKSLFKQLGKSIFFIAFFESFIAFIFVFVAMYLWEPDKLYQALVLGAVASATAPAATVVVLNQYKARGALTSTILAVVGIDDAIALIIFVFASTIAKSTLIGEHISYLKVIMQPIIEIGGSFLLGIIVAFVVNFLFKKVRSPEDVLVRVTLAIFFILGVSITFDFSELLAVMAFAAVLVNINPLLNNRFLKVTTYLGPLFFAMFFILAGSKLDIKLIPVIGIMGLIYFLSRFAGKYLGATLGAFIGGAPKVVRKYVGLGLIPQVGVAVAMAIIVDKTFGNGDFGEPGILLSKIVINVLLLTTIATEVIGPLLTKYAITKADERNI